MTNPTPSEGKFPEKAPFTEDSPSRPDGDNMHVDDVIPPAPDQTDEQRELTDLIGLVQSRAEAEGWQVEAVPSDAPSAVFLGLTSPSGRDFSLMANPTH